MSLSINGFTILTKKLKENTYEIHKVTTSTSTKTERTAMSTRKNRSEELSNKNHLEEEVKKVKLKRPSKIMKVKEAERKLYENLQEMVPTISRQRTKQTRVEILAHTTEFINVLERMMIDLKATGDS